MTTLERLFFLIYGAAAYAWITAARRWVKQYVWRRRFRRRYIEMTERYAEPWEVTEAFNDHISDSHRR